MIIKADFHIHSTVSPCAELEMSPKNIARRAKECGLDLIALADHNTALNAPAFEKACAEEKINCIFGIEIETLEEAHILCFFDNLKTITEISKLVYKRLPQVPHNPTIFGDQVFVNEHEEILGNVEKYLGAATTLTVAETVKLTHENNGIVIPSHVDKSSFSLISQLGFVPEEDFDALEIYRSSKASKPVPKDYPLISNSDAHFLEDIGTVFNILETKSLCVKDLKESFKRARIITLQN